MKRDLDLIRDLLLFIEENVEFQSTDWHFKYDHKDPKAVGYALKLMRERGLIESLVVEDSGTTYEDAHHDVVITWEGHDFLDTVRDDEIWKKTKEGVKAGGGFSFDIMKALSKGLIKKKIMKHTGVELEF